MLGLRKKVIATVASLAMVGLPFAAGGAAFAQSSTTSTSTSTTTSSGTTSTVGYKNVSFTDVTSSTPQYDSIIELAALGLVNGYPDGTYKPSTPVTRADMAKLVDIALGLQSAATGDTGASSFSDVPAGQWYTGYVNVAAAKGIINGFPKGTFLPDASVTYAQAVTMVVRALGYEPNVVGPWPSGYMAEAANIQNSSGQYTLLSGLSNQLDQPMDRADVARLVNNMLYAVPANLQFKVTSGNTQVTTTQPSARTQAAQLGYNLYYPGNDQTAPPLSDCYGNVVTGTILTNPALNPNQVQITSLNSGSCGSSPVVGTTSNTYTLAPTVGIVGATSLINLTGYQVSFATNNQGQVVFIGAVTPSNDALVGASLGSELQITSNNGVGQLPTGINQISIEPSGATGFQSYNVASGAIAVPNSGTFKGSNGSNDSITAILNPNGDVIAVIDTDRLTQYKDVYLTGVTTLNGSQTLEFYDGSTSNTNLGIAAGAVVTVDGQPATLSDLKKGMVLNISVNSQSQATSIQASDKTVTGTITNISVQTTGTTFMTVNGTQYKVRGTATYAENGSPVGGIDNSVLNGLDNNSATVYIGVDNHIGYIDVTNSNTVVGLALNPVVGTTTSASTLEVETSNGGVTAYPVESGLTYDVHAGDMVRLTLNAASGAATIVDYSADASGNTLYGTYTSPALVLGVLGNELRVQTGQSTPQTVDLYAPTDVAVFEGTGGGSYPWTDLNTANTGAGSIATTASTTTLSTIQPGYYVTLGATSGGTVKGILYLNQNGAAGPSSAASTKNIVDVAVPTAETTTSGQLGTAGVAPLGATTPINVSLESSATYPQNTTIGNDAGTNSSVFQLQLIGGSLAQTATNVSATSPYDYSAPSGLTESNTLTFSSLVSGPAFTTNDGSQFSYGSGTVVLNVPNDQIEPIGSLIPGQQVIVFSQTMPSGETMAQFVEVVNTATNISTTNGTSSISVNATDTGTQVTVSGTVYEEYAVTGTAPGSSTQVPTVIVSATNSAAAFVSGTYVQSNATGAALPTSNSAQATVSQSGSSYSAFVLVPKGANLITTINVSSFGGTSSGTGSTTITQ